MKIFHTKIILSLVFILLINNSFVSCKKIENISSSENLSQVKIKIQSWLALQKKENNDKRNNWIDELDKNLIYNQSWSEINDNVLFFIIPISNTLKFKNNKGQKVGNYFVSAVNQDFKIIYSLILQYKPTNNQNSTELSKGVIADIFSNKSLKVDCNIRFISIFDNFLYSKNYDNNNHISTLILSKKINKIVNNTSTNSISNCIDWYWVTTYSDGSQTWEYAYTSCSDDSCYDSNDASICADDGSSGGIIDTQPIPTDPCLDALAGSTKATNLSNNNLFILAKTNIINAAINGNEHGITFGRDSNGTITTSNISNGSGSSGTVPNWPGAFADLHNHNNATPPSSGDIYGFIDRVNANNTFETRYILTNNGNLYALTVTNLQQANNFNLTHPRVPSPPGTNYEPAFPSEIVDEINQMKGLFGASEEMAIAFVIEKYKMGIALLKQDSTGNFKRLNTLENKSNNGNIVSYISNNCQ